MPKTLFHTTDKSNFILNMDLDKFRVFCSKLLAALMMIVGGSEIVFQLSYSYTTDLNDMIQEGGFGMFLSLLIITLRSIATIFSIVGVIAVVAAFIGGMRQQLSKKNLLPYGLLGAGFLWAVISLFNSFSYRDSLFGQDGRDEGLFTLLIYGCLFLVGSMLRRKENIMRTINLVLGFGLFQCLWGLLQCCPFFEFPNAYKFVDPLLKQNLFLPCGLTDSPITFAMLLTMLLCLAIPAAVFAEKKAQRVYATVSAGVFWLLLLKTQTIASVLGAGFTALLAVILLICGRKKKQGKSVVLLLTMVLSIGVSAVWVYFSPSINGAYTTWNNAPVADGFAVYDGGIVWDDGFYRLSTACAYSSFREHDFEIGDASSVIRYAWSEGVRTIKRYPIVGTGPDCFWYMQLRENMALLSNCNGVDRPYNDFLYIAASRGIPALLLYVALLAVCIGYGIRRRKQTASWVYLSAIFAVLGFTLTSMVGISVLSVSPLLWMMLGVLIGEPLDET